MKTMAMHVLMSLTIGLTPLVFADSGNPLAAVIKMLDELAIKLEKDGETEDLAYRKYFRWCSEVTLAEKIEVENDKKQKAMLAAKMLKLKSDAEAAAGKIEDEAAEIAATQADLKQAKEVRDAAVAEFRASETELMETIDTVSRAITVIEREMQKHPSSFAQVTTSSMAGVIEALNTVIDAAAFTSTDRQKLLALVQSQDNSEYEFTSPAAASYTGHGANILEVLEDMKEKAESQLSELRLAEVRNKASYNELVVSLGGEIKADNKDLHEEKTDKASAEEGKADAKGDIKVATKEEKSDSIALTTAKSDCMQTANDHEQSLKARSQEMKAVKEAREVLVSMTSDAASQSYSLVQKRSAKGTKYFFLQLRSTGEMTLRAGFDAASSEVVKMVKRLAKMHHSSALAQLASRINAIARYGASNGESPFEKVKGLITDLISKLEKEAEREATEKAYCDEQMSETESKKGELEDDISKLATQIDQSSAKSAELKEDVKELQAELAALAKQRAEIDKIREETHENFLKAKADLEEGLTGVRKALAVLQEYYGNKQDASLLQSEASGDANLLDAMQQPAPPQKYEKSEGAANGIIEILDMIESDFATTLAKEETQESDAQSDYEKTTQDMRIEQSVKEQDVEFKTQQFKSLDKSITQLSSDRDSALSEQAAVLEYYEKVKDRCIAKPDSFEERRKRREAEIAGLREALEILKNEAAFAQRSHRNSRLRGMHLSMP